VAWTSVFVRPAPAVRTGLANKSDFNVDWALNSIFAWALVICVLVMSSSGALGDVVQGAMQRGSGRFYMGSGTRAQGEAGVQEIIGARRRAALATQRPGWARGKVRGAKGGAG
jgi:hypothetical protein